MRKARGFSLIELVIALAIAAVLAALAVSVYSRYVLRAQRSDGQQALLQLMHAQERWYSAHARYTDDWDKLGLQPQRLAGRGYALGLQLEGDDDQAYIASATPIGVQRRDACGVLSIDSHGHKRPGADDAGAQRNGRCW